MTNEQEKQGKYGALIQKAREQENQKVGKPDNQTTRQPEVEKQNNQKTRKTENQKSVKPERQLAKKSENQKTVKPEIEETLSQKSVKPESQMTNQAGKEKPDNQQTRIETSQKTGNPANQMASKPDGQQARLLEREVNLCVKVPESLRRHWAAESKREGITMTEVIVQALEARFGRPE